MNGEVKNEVNEQVKKIVDTLYQARLLVKLTYIYSLYSSVQNVYFFKSSRKNLQLLYWSTRTRSDYIDWSECIWKDNLSEYCGKTVTIIAL